MSTDISLWDPELHGLPKEFEGAVEAYLKLSQSIEALPNQKIIAFSTILEEQLNHGELDDQLKSCFSGLVTSARQNKNALFQVGLPAQGAMDGLRLILEAARTVGLVVFYDLFGAVFLPDGHIYPESKAEIWQGALNYLDDPAPDFPRTLKAFQKLVDSLFIAMAERHGMKKVKVPFFKDTEGFVRDVGGSQQYIILSISGRGGEHKIDVYLYIYNSLLRSIYECFEFELLNNNVYYSIKLIVELSKPNIEKYEEVTNRFEEITSHEKLNGALDFFEEIIFTQILDVAIDMKGLDYLMNSNVDDHVLRKSVSFYSPHSLIVASLAGNPDFEALVTQRQAKENWGANNKAKATELPKLLKYLREEVKPIV
jgi:hypothetical protein